LVQGGAVIAVLVALMVVELAPTFVFWARHGQDHRVAHRAPAESEAFGLKFAQLVLPVEHHRIGPLGRARERYDNWFPQTEATRSTTLGVVGAFGFLWLVAVGLLQMAGPGRRVASPLAGQAAVAVVVALLFAWTGGLATLVASVYPQVRAWNRLSIFIGFFALFAVGLLLDRVLAGRSRWLVGAALGAVLVVGVLDQTTRFDEPLYAARAVEYRSDGDFVRAVEARAPRGAMVLQLPHVPFPESRPPGRMNDYDEMHGYLHSDDLRWSYGAIKGRDDRLAVLSEEKDPGDLVRGAEALGFKGIYIDRAGYDDNAAKLEAELGATLATEPLVSPNGRLSFFAFGG
jgi:phosphoglycerol transferase